MNWVKSGGYFHNYPHDPMGNPIVTDWCPNLPCPFLPGSTHKHSLILDEDRSDYINRPKP